MSWSPEKTIPIASEHEVLDSWKSIASYLGRQVRTVNLWERTESLPVHRHVHRKRGTVFALKSELDRWKQERSSRQSDPRVPTFPRSRRTRSMIAVLPFQDFGGDPAQGFFHDGFTEEMISQLGQASPEEIGVIARTTSMRYKHTVLSIASIGHELNVDYVLEGSVRRSGNRIRISARLVQVTDQSTVWSSQMLDYDLADIFRVEREVVASISDAITRKLTSAQPHIVSAPPRPTNSDAYEAYLKARHAWNQRTEEGLWRAVHYFKVAIEKDSQLAVAYSGLADAYNLLAVYSVLPPHEAMPLAERSAAQALQINPNLGEAYVTLADVTLFYRWDWSGARQRYERGIQLNPSNPTAHHYYAYYLAAAGEHEQALIENDLAHASDPYSIIILVWKAVLLRLAGRYAEAVSMCHKALVIDPHYVLAHWALGLACEQLHDYDQATAEIEKAVWLSGGNPGMLSALGHVQGVSGRCDEAMRTAQHLMALSEKRYVSAFDLAMVQVGLRNTDECIKLFQKAGEERSNWIVTLPQEPRTRHLLSNSRFRRMLKNQSCCGIWDAAPGAS